LKSNRRGCAYSQYIRKELRHKRWDGLDEGLLYSLVEHAQLSLTSVLSKKKRWIRVSLIHLENSEDRFSRWTILMRDNLISGFISGFPYT